MTENKTVKPDEPQPADEQDVEGHNLWISPTMSRDMASNRSKEIEREAKARQREKDAKGR